MVIQTTALTSSELQSAIVRDPLVVTPDTTVMAAIAQMSGIRTQCSTAKTADSHLSELHLEARSSCVLIVEDGRLLGIMTERDVVRLSAQQQTLETLAIGDVMARPIVTLQETALTDLLVTINLLQQHQIRHLPIVDEQDRLIGLVTHESLRQLSRPVDLLRLRLVAEVMTRDVVCAAPESSMLTIAQRMADHRISSIMIVQPRMQPDDNAAPLSIPVGIVTERDMVQFRALGLDLEAYLAEAVMSTPIFAVKPEDSLWRVQQIMEQRLIRRLAVTGDQGELLGIVTQTSLLNALNPLELYKLAELLEQKVYQLEVEKVNLLESRTTELEHQVEVRTAALKATAEREKLVAQIATQVRSSLSLETILETTVAQVRQVLGCDRVNIWQFTADGQTILVAESTDSSLSLLGERIDDTCFKQSLTEMYRQGQIRVVSDIYTTEMADCHREMLIRFQTRAKILVPLFCGDHLWGLLNVTESQHPREWQPEEVELLQALAVQLAIALQQATTHERLQAELSERQQAEARLRQSEAKSRAVLEAIPDLMIRLGADGVYREMITPRREFDAVPQTFDRVGHLVTDVLPAHIAQQYLHYLNLALETGEMQIYEQQFPVGDRLQDEEVRVIKSGDDEVLFIIRDISERKAAQRERQQAQAALQQLNQDLERQVAQRTAALEASEATNRATLNAIPDLLLRLRRDGTCLEYIKPGLETDKSLLIVQHISEVLPPDLLQTQLHRIEQAIATGDLQVYEHQFVKQGRAIYEEVRIIALNDQEVLAIVRDISDRKQAEQTIRHQAEREILLREITQRIRQSLDLQTIFDTACHDIRQMIHADRVGIFKFYPDSNFEDGEFVAESGIEGIPCVTAIRIHDHCFGETYAPLYLQGRYAAMEDIYQLEDRCHTDVLARFQVRANLVMPLLCGDELWGLLCIHQCGTTHQWQPDEIELTQQIANQLAIAIQQANLYNQLQAELLVRQQAETKIALQLQQQEVLGAIIQQIRRSLDITEILAVITQQVKAVLQGDRVIVFQLFPDGRSQLVAEALSGNLVALKDRHWDNEVWSQDILDYYWQGNPRIVHDVMNDTWTNCLVEYNLEGQIQSKIVAPILQDRQGSDDHRWVSPTGKNRLWGVLVVHACQEKRFWKESEAQLLQQIANQLAIAIQQANLFEQLQQELTERQQAQQQLTEINQQLATSNEELARATRLKDEFLANMSHELRTPLNSILGMTEGLQEQVYGTVTDRQITALQTIERSGFHLLELITDILDVAKIESGQMELDIAPTAIAPLCHASMAFVKQQAMKKGIQLEIKLQLNLPELLVDERRIRQVLINLLNNAVKFTPDHGRITLEVSPTPLPDERSVPPLKRGARGEQVSLGASGEQGEARPNPPQSPLERRTSSQSGSVPPLTRGVRGDQSDLDVQGSPEGEGQGTRRFLRIMVTDTGIGIAPEHMSKLFKPFVQIDSALNRKYEGTGLGLALVKRIADLHGGRVSLSSEVGVGSCFTIDLPCSDTPQALRKTEHQSGSSAEISQLEQLTSPLILLAEDNEANISTISSYLEAKGYRILLAKNGQEAIDLTAAHHPDLILMDIQMPEVDGLEAIRQIRANPEFDPIPIVALTALAMPDDRQTCLDAGATEYIAKPIKLKALSQTIQTLLAKE